MIGEAFGLTRFKPTDALRGSVEWTPQEIEERQIIEDWADFQSWQADRMFNGTMRQFAPQSLDDGR